MKISGRTWLVVALAGGAALLYLSSRSNAAQAGDVVPVSGNDASTAGDGSGAAQAAGGGGADTAALLAALGQQNSDLVGQLLTTSKAFGSTSSSGVTGPTGNPSNVSPIADTAGTDTTTAAAPDATSTSDVGSSIGLVAPAAPGYVLGMPSATASGATIIGTYPDLGGGAYDPGFGSTTIASGSGGEVQSALALKGYVNPTTELSSGTIKPAGQAVAT